MNIIFGGSHYEVSIAELFRKKVADQYGQQLASVHPVTNERNGGQWLDIATKTDSPVLGRAVNREQKIAVAILGCLNSPVPAWTDGSPMDCPDTTAEYILARYIELGDKFAEGLFGQYVIVIQDSARNRVLLVSDPTGIRTAFYKQNGNSISFSSNLALLASCAAGVTINKEYENFLLCYGYIPSQRTLFEEIQYLRPGALLCFENGSLSCGTVDHPVAWEGFFGGTDEALSSEEKAVDALYEAFMLATEQQLSSDKKAAVLLGGADSALTASALHRLGKEVETFSFYYGDEGFDQPHTDTLSKFLGTKHHWIPITPEMMRDGIEAYPWTFNFPTNWPNYVIQTQALCNAIRERGFKYIYSGDGCDGTFLGYPRTHVFAKFLNSTGHLNASAVQFLTRSLNTNIFEFPMGRAYTQLLNSIRSVGRQMPERGYSTFRVMDENSLARLKNGNADEIAKKNEQILRDLAAPLAGLSMDRLAYSGKNAISPNRSKLAGSSDSADVVINSPYLHSGMKQFAMSIPDKFLRPADAKDGYNGKYLLFKMCEEKGLLPREIIHQKKISAVHAPVDQWYLGQLKEQLRDKLTKLPFDTDDKFTDFLLNDQLADKAYRRYISSDALTSHALALLTTYATFTELLE